MFQRLIDDFKDSLATSMRLTSLMAAMALTLFVTLAFLCAAAFVYVLQTYGLIQACLAGAAIFPASDPSAAAYLVEAAKSPSPSTTAPRPLSSKIIVSPRIRWMTWC